MNECCCTSLAIASVPVQHADCGKLYSPEDALLRGTIFPELHLPFFATEQLTSPKHDTQTPGQQLLFELSAVGLCLQDLSLYLETHETDAEMLQLFHQLCDKYKTLSQSFCQQYYPLTKADACTGNQIFAWTQGPAPWEGGCC